MDKYLTTRDVAEILKISYDKALELMHSYELGAVKIGRQYRVTEAKLNEYLHPESIAQAPRKKLKKRANYFYER